MHTNKEHSVRTGTGAACVCVFSPFLASAFAAAACGFGVELFPAFFAFLPAFSFAMACRKPPVASLELAAESPNTAVRRGRRAAAAPGKAVVFLTSVPRDFTRTSTQYNSDGCFEVEEEEEEEEELH